MKTSKLILQIDYIFQPEKSWEIDLDHLETMIDDNTAAIVIINPSNPCGSVFSMSHIKDILKLASQYKIPIIADEVYEHIVSIFKYVYILNISVSRKPGKDQIHYKCLTE